jgi:cell division protein FtsB
MTDFQNWWDGYFHEINGQKETAQAAWQARGALDAVRIKDLTALVVQQDKDNNNYAKEIIELTAKNKELEIEVRRLNNELLEELHK